MFFVPHDRPDAPRHAVVRARRLLVGFAATAALTVGAACSSTTETTSPTTAGTRVGTTVGTATSAAATTSGTALGTTPGTKDADATIQALPVSATQKTCLTQKLDADPTLKVVVETKKQYTKAEATKFVNLMLSCMPRADLVAVILSAQPNPDTAEAKCQASKISQLDEDQLAGFLAQDPATLKELQAGAAQCAALGTTSTTR